MLPTNSSQACTAAVTELTYQPQSFSAEVVFYTKDEWTRLFKKLRAAVSDPDSSKEAKEIFKALYGTPHPPDTAKLNSKLDNAVRTGRKEFNAATADELMSHLAVYIDSAVRSDSKDVILYWPLVKVVRIKGPFMCLQGGLRLVDLPGSNDRFDYPCFTLSRTLWPLTAVSLCVFSNKAREDVAKKYFKMAQYLWILAPIKRAASSKTASILVSDALNKRFRREMLLAGLLSNLSVVATCADEVNASEVVRNLGITDLNPNNPDDEIAIARRRVRCGPEACGGFL
jgi:hypothetical protein